MGTKFDFHMHSIFSDGSDSPEELIKNLKKSGIEKFALTDHDTIEGCEAVAALVPEDMEFTFGIEFSSRTEAGKCHILGYGCDPHNEKLLAAIEEGRVLRRTKLETRLTHLREVHGIVFDQEEMAYLYSLSSVGKPHLARLLMKKGLAGDIGEAIRQYINGCKTGNDRIAGKTAVEAILAAGGIPVWAHPLGGEGEKHLADEQFQKQLDTLMKIGIKGLECFYSRYSLEETGYLKANAKKNHLLISGGSDYHGINKDIPLGMLNEKNVPIAIEEVTLPDALR